MDYSNYNYTNYQNYTPKYSYTPPPAPAPEPSAPPMEDYAYSYPRYPQPVKPKPEQVKPKLRELDKTEDCPICFENIAKRPDGDDRLVTVIAKTECQHFFHEFCLKKFLNYGVNENCPMCRNSLANRNRIKEIRLYDTPPARIPAAPKIDSITPVPLNNDEEEEPSLSSLFSASWNALGKATNYVGVKMLNALSETPSLENIVAKWNERKKSLETKMAKEKEEIELLLTLLASLPDSPYTQKSS